MKGNFPGFKFPSPFLGRLLSIERILGSEDDGVSKEEGRIVAAPRSAFCCVPHLAIVLSRFVESPTRLLSFPTFARALAWS